MNIILKEKQRFDFLHKLYEISNGISDEEVDIEVVTKNLELQQTEALSAIDWLKGADLIKDPEEARFDPKDYIQITHSGVKEIESALSTPKEATKYFAPVNTLHQHITINNSPGVQVGDGNSQTTNLITQNNHQLFQKLETATNDQISDKVEREIILSKIKNLEASIGTTNSISSYQEFMSSVSNHITVFAPFLAEVSLLLS